jgi:hypothetical protein
MSDITAARVGVTALSAPRPPLPLGFGMLAAALVSLGLWGGLFWLASLAF